MLLLPSAALADVGRLAVLELAGDLERTVLATLTDQVRAGTLIGASDSGVLILTRENMAAMAREMGLDLACAEADAECQVDVARNIGADLVISGDVARFGNDGLVATLKLHDTNTGGLLATETLQAEKEIDLVASLRVASERLIQRHIQASGHPAGDRGAAPATDPAEPAAVQREGRSAGAGRPPVSLDRVAWGDERRSAQLLTDTSSSDGFHLSYEASHPLAASEHELHILGRLMIRLDAGGELKIALANKGRPPSWPERGRRLGARWLVGTGAAGNKIELWYDGDLLVVQVNGLDFGPYRLGELEQGPWEVRLTRGVELHALALAPFGANISGQSATELKALSERAGGEAPVASWSEFRKVTPESSSEAAAALSGGGAPGRFVLSYRAHHRSRSSEHELIVFGTLLFRIDVGGVLKIAELGQDAPARRLEPGRRLGSSWVTGRESAGNAVRLDYADGDLEVTINERLIGSYHVGRLVAAPWRLTLTDDGTALEDVRYEGLGPATGGPE